MPFCLGLAQTLGVWITVSGLSISEENMKTLGIFLLSIGIIWGVVTFNLETTVETEDQYIAGIYIPGGKIHNIGKMDEKRNHLILSALLIITGVVLFGFSSIRPSSVPTSPSKSTRRCPHCAEVVQEEANVCRYCQRDLPSMSELRAKEKAEQHRFPDVMRKESEAARQAKEKLP